MPLREAAEIAMYLIVIECNILYKGMIIPCHSSSLAAAVCVSADVPFHSFILDCCIGLEIGLAK